MTEMHQAPLSPRGPAAGEVPVTFAQEQLWFIDEFHNGLPAHNLPSLIRLTGVLDVAALGRAIDGLVARHEALRTRLLSGPQGRPVQVVDPPGASGALELVDLSGLEPAQRQARLREVIESEALAPFTLAEGPLLRACLVKLAPAEHALSVVTHQTVFDDWSLRVFFRELAALYETAQHAAAVTGDPASAEQSGLAQLPVQFADYALWERRQLTGQVLTDLEDFWRGALGGFEESLFPVDRPRPLLASHDGAVQVTTMDAELLDGLRELSGAQGGTLAETLLAAVQVLVHRYTGQTDVVIGTTGANRDRPELEPLIGYLAATLPVRADLSGDPTFTELLGRVRAAAAAAAAHQQLPFAKVVEALHIQRDIGRFPVFQIAFSATEPIADIEAAGVRFSSEHVELHASRYDISFAAEPTPEGLRLATTYTPALFDAATVARLVGNLEVLLRGLVADPAARLSALPVLTERELHAELIEWNDTAADFPVICIHSGFEEQVRRTPDGLAAEYSGERWSYAELNARANQIARRLRGLGVGPEVLVGVCMATGLTRLAALLGVWKAGGGYVPLDPALPPDRLSFMMADTAMAVLLADNPGVASLPGTEALTVVRLDEELASITALAGTDLADTGVTPENVAYVIYTSGSTGQPKGVIVEHRQALNFLQGMIWHWRIGPDDAVLQFAAFTFDVSVMDMFMPLLAGAAVLMAEPETLHSPPRLAALLRERKVSFACLPPAVLSLLIGEEFPDLRILLSAGEELSSELLRAWMRDGLDIYNGYGPTEASIGATFMLLEPSTPLPPPIGRPKPNYRAYVLDGQLNPVPVGVVGELHVGGPGVARGYLNRPELTKERFIADPFGGTPGGRLYKTGDLVRRRPDGTIVFAGRSDNQVKIRGLRVELGEIEAALAGHPDVAQAFVTTITDQAGEKQLAGYLRPVSPPPDAQLDLTELRAHLARQLPAYMIPGYLVQLEQFPLTTNGKIDKAALPAPETSQADAERVPPGTLIEMMMVELYASVLGNEQVGAVDSFFDLGGSSLQAMRLIALMNNELEVDIGIASVFLAPTPRQLAVLLRDKHGLLDEELGAEGLAGLTESTA